MADQEKVVLLKIENNLEDTVRAMAEYQAEIERLDAEQVKLAKDLDEGRISQDEYRKAMVRAKEEKKAYGKEVRELSRKVQNSLVAENKYKDSLKGMAAELSKQKDILRAMKTTDPGWKDQRDKVAALNEQMKELEQSYGVYGRDVGHYTVVLGNLKKEQKELYGQMLAMKLEGRENSEEYRKAAERAAELRDAQMDVREQTNALASDTKNLDGAMEGTALAMGGLAIVGAFFDDGTEEGKRFNEVMQKLSVVSIAIVGITKIYQSLQKQGILMQMAQNVQAKAAIALTKMQTAATVAQTVAQRVLNAVMKANPIFLIIGAIVALVSAVAAFIKIMASANAVQDEANRKQEQYEKWLEKTEQAEERRAIRAKNRAKGAIDAISTEIVNRQRAGASAKEIEELKRKQSLMTLKQELRNNRESLESSRKMFSMAAKNMKAQGEALNVIIATKGAASKAAHEQAEQYRKALGQYNTALQNYVSAREAKDNAIYALEQAQWDNRQRAMEEQYKREVQTLNAADKLYQQAYKRRLAFMYDYTQSEQENEIRKFQLSQSLELNLFNLQQRTARKKLDLDKKNGKITAEEYKNELAVLNSEAKTFAQTQSNAVAEFTRNMLTQAIELAGGKMLDVQLEDIKAKYADARKQIARDTEMSAEEMAYYIDRLNDEEAQALKDARLDSMKETEDAIKKVIDERYRYDVRQFSESATEQIALEVEKQKALIAEKKKAGQHTLADEAELAKSEAKLRQAELDKTLAMEWRNADARYLAQKAYYERELELAQDNAEKRAELEQKLTELNVAHHQQKIDTITEYAQQSLEILGSLNDVLNAFQERDLQKYEKDNEAKKKSLQNQLDAGLISQKQHDKQVAKLDADLDQKKAEIARKQAIRERILSTGQIAMNTATAIMKLWAEVPKVDYGAATIALTAMASALGAAQLAAVWAAPLPMAREGGLIQGPTHESGGVLINAEGGERIISRNPAKAFPELLNLMSYIGKHSNIPDTGYSARVFGSVNGANDIDMDALADRIGARMVEAVRGLNIAVAVEDIRKADREYTKVEQSSRM